MTNYQLKVWEVWSIFLHINLLYTSLVAQSCQVVAIYNNFTLLINAIKIVNKKGASVVKKYFALPPRKVKWGWFLSFLTLLTAGGGAGNDRVSLKRSEPFKRASFEPTSSIANWSRPKLLRAPLQWKRRLWNFSISSRSGADRKREEIRTGGIISTKRRANKVGRWKIFINKSAPHARAPPSLMSRARERAKLFFPHTLPPDVFVRATVKLQKLQGKSKKMEEI